MEREDSTFFQTLFNWDFTEFLTVRIIKFTYIFWTILIGLYVIGGEFYCGRQLEGWARIGGVILVPLVGLIVLIYIRVILELTFVYFRSERHLRKIAKSD